MDLEQRQPPGKKLIAAGGASRHSWAALTGLLLSFAVLALGAVLGDRALLARVSQGDLKAFRSLFDRAAPRALAVSLRILKDRSEAEDVVQDVFIQAWRAAESFDASRGDLTTWIATMARSRALDRLRSRSTSARASTALQAEPPAASVRGPLEAVEERVNRERVNGALKALPVPQREALELAYFEGLTQSEIAARTGEPLGTVKTRTRLALRKLSELLAENEAAS